MGAKSYPWLLDITGDTPVMFAASLPTDTGVQRAAKCIKVPSCPKCRKAHLLHGAKSYPWLLDITGDTPVMFATTWRKSAAAWHNNVPQVGTPHKTVNTGNCTADHLSNTHFCAQAAKPIKRPRNPWRSPSPQQSPKRLWPPACPRPSSGSVADLHRPDSNIHGDTN
jgi:hypothetical protein